MSRFVRQSKVRHVYGETAKPPFHFTNLRFASFAGDQQHIKADHSFFAVPVARGSLTVIPLDAPGKKSHNLPLLDGHKGKVVDFDFAPVSSGGPNRDSIVATGGDDSTLQIWKIPQTGLEETRRDCDVMMTGHLKKVNVVRFNPNVEDVCATGSSDHTVRLWDTNQGELKNTIKLDEMVQDLVWDHYGKTLAASTKDKKLSLIDPRASSPTIESVEAHDGSKPCKVVYLGESNKLCTVGFSRSSVRSFKLWDPRKSFAAPLCDVRLDQSAGSMLPFYDSSLNLLYIGGKGDSNLRYFELTDSDPFQYKISEFRAHKPCKGMCVLPKRNVDVGKHEVIKFLRLTDESVEPTSFFCPRKSDLFQADIFPDCHAGIPAAQADDFFEQDNEKMENLQPIVKSMNPDDVDSVFNLKANGSSGDGEKPIEVVKKKSKRELEVELEVAKKYIKELTAKMEAAALEVPKTPEGLTFELSEVSTSVEN